MTTASRALLIVHPRARRHIALPSFVESLRVGYRLEVQESLFAGHTLEICRNHLLDSGDTVIFTAGGDGTFHEAINAWAAAGFPEGVHFAPLPLGSGNDFLYSIDPSFRHFETYLRRPLLERRQADLGQVSYQTAHGPDSRYFCVGATAGFSALVCFRRARLANLVPGSLSYLLALLLSLGSWRNTWCRWDGAQTPPEHAVFFAFNCANVKYYGGGMVSAPRANPFSGRLDGVTMNLTLPEVLRALPENFRGNFDAVRNVEQFPIEEPLTLFTGRPCQVQADGEPLGQTPMAVRCLPARLPLLLPAPP